VQIRIKKSIIVKDIELIMPYLNKRINWKKRVKL